MRSVSNKRCRQNQNTNFIFSNVFPKIVPRMPPNNVVEPHRSHTIWRPRVGCWIIKGTRTQAHARARAPITTHPHKHGSTQAHACLHPLARVQAFTHIQKNIILFAFTRQQWFRKCASMLRYRYIACLVYKAKCTF
jgi:hypothetical protein